MSTWYTKARRQPTMIGKDAAGQPIPGGPYLLQQFVAAPIVGLVLWNTRELWGSDTTILAHLVFTLGGGAIAGYLVGRLDFTTSNPIWAVTGLVKAVVRAFISPAGTASVGSYAVPKQSTVLAARLQVLPLPGEASTHAAPEEDLVVVEQAQPGMERTAVDHAGSAPVPPAPASAPPTTPQQPPATVPAQPSGLENFLALAERSLP